ncbi:UPF0235 protein C15orf40 homolog [Thunnus albacares]|uniref:UPF0235 protein C15orf40 homolog n=1 Tax=Thunnus albacares TaxID=8236 RepID=UPI001CF6123C|nr:UPF0235 protein C15orf40 homolog [Thunnus albacares]
MFSRSGLITTGVFIRSLKSCQPLGVVTLHRFSDFCCGRLTVLSRSRLPPPPGAPRVRRYSKNTQMPQKAKAAKKQPAAAQAEASGPVTRDKSGAVAITVHAKPGSKHSGITEVSAEAVGVAIAAPPTDGEANTELIRYLAEVLGLKKSHISLDKGSRSRDKLIRVDSSLSPEEVLQRLREAAG